MELRLPLEVFPGRQATCRAVFGTWGSFPDDARASHCPFVLTSFTGWSSERCPGIGFLSRGDREIGVFRNVEPPTCQTDSAAFLMHINQHATALLVDPPERLANLIAAIAPLRAKDVAGKTFRMQAH